MRRIALLVALLALISCNPESAIVPPLDEDGSGSEVTEPELAILDGSKDGGNPGFHFQPPIVRRIYRPTGEFASDLYEFLTVEICEWDGEACVGDPVSTFTHDGEHGERLHKLQVLKTYVAFWNTRRDGLDPDKLYRIIVKAGPVELGYADVDILRRLRDAKDVDRDEFVALPDDWTLPIAFTVETPQWYSFCSEGRLTIGASAGVEPQPAAGTQDVPCGSSIAYEFAERDGYYPPSVWLDDQPVPSTGRVLVTGHHLLVAVARPRLTVSPEAESVRDDLLDALRGPNPGEEFQAFLHEHGDFLSDVGNELTLRAINEAIIQELGLDALGQLYATLNGQVFEVSDGASPAAAVIRPLQAPGDRRTAVVYVNGIWSDLLSVGRTAQELHRVTRESGITNNSSFFVWNSSGVYNPLSDNPDREGLVCVLDALNYDIEGTSPSVLARLASECGWAPVGHLLDLSEALSELINRAPAPEDSRQVAEQLKNRWLGQGWQVIVVAHSQGNLIVRDALEDFQIVTPDDRQRLGVISLAAPAPAVSTSMSVGAFQCWIVEGDGIEVLANPLDACNERVSTGYSNALGLFVDACRVIRACPSVAMEAVVGVALHSMDGSYLRMPGVAGGARLRLRAALLDEWNQLGSSAGPGSIFDDFNDGDFTSNPTWSEWNLDDYPGVISVQGGALRFFRTGAGSNGASLGVEMNVDIPVSEDTHVVFDAQAASRSVTGGCGVQCGEYPANVQLTVEDAIGNTYLVRYAVNYGGAVQDQATGNFRQFALSIPQGTWARDLTYRVRDAWPTAVRIRHVHLFAAGWDLEGYIDNIRIQDIAGPPGGWQRLTDHPTTGGTEWSGIGLAVANGHLVTFGGSVNPCTTTNQSFAAPILSDGTIGGWMRRSDYVRTSNFDGMQAIANGDNVIGVAGWDCGWYHNAVGVGAVDPLGNITWSGSTFPRTQTGNATVVSGGFVYALGGVNINCPGPALANATYATINGTSIGAWQETTPMPAARNDVGVVALQNGQIFVMGGLAQGCATSTNTIWVSQRAANGTLSSWQAAGTLPSAGYFRGGGAFLVDQGTVLIGLTDDAGVTRFYRGTISGNAIGNWQDLGTGPGSFLNYAYHNGAVYALGGGRPAVYRRTF